MTGGGGGRPARSVALAFTDGPHDRRDIRHGLIMPGEKYANVWNAKKLPAFVSESVCEGDRRAFSA